MTRSRPPLAVALALAAAVAIPACAAAPASAPDAARTAPDFTAYQRLLDDYLVVTSAPGAALETRVDYVRLRAAKDRAERFARIRRGLLQTPPSRMDRATRLAWAINTYNFLVIEAVTEHLLQPGRGLVRLASVRDIRTPQGGFFQREVVTVEGESYSLDAFERRFAFDGFERLRGSSPPPGFEPRLHFALVCAAVGCPPLQPRAFAPATLERQLDEATRATLASPAHLTWNRGTREVAASAIFEWYATDFGGADASFAFLLRHAPPEARAAIERARVGSIARTLPWDWALNQAPAPKAG